MSGTYAQPQVFLPQDAKGGQIDLSRPNDIIGSFSFDLIGIMEKTQLSLDQCPIRCKECHGYLSSKSLSFWCAQNTVGNIMIGPDLESCRDCVFIKKTSGKSIGQIIPDEWVEKMEQEKKLRMKPECMQKNHLCDKNCIL